jgi:hypothetical protein
MATSSTFISYTTDSSTSNNRSSSNDNSNDRNTNNVKNHSNSNRVWLIPEPSVVVPSSISGTGQVSSQSPCCLPSCHHIVYNISKEPRHTAAAAAESQPTQLLHVELLLNDIDSTPKAIINDIRQALHHTIRNISHHRNSPPVHLLLIQFPEPFFSDRQRLAKLWNEIEKLVNNQMVQYVGLHNSNEEQLEAVLSVATNVKPYAILINHHEYFTQPDRLNKMSEYCRRNNVTPLAGNSILNTCGMICHELRQYASKSRWFVHYSTILPETSLIMKSGCILSEKTL